MKQLDLFGGETEFEKVCRPRKTKTMQEMYGITEEKECRTCTHLYCKQWQRNYYKCELWDDFFRGSSEASDVRLKSKACGKYAEEARSNV